MAKASCNSVLILHQRVHENSSRSDVGVLEEVAAVRSALHSLKMRSRVAAVDSTEEVLRAVLAGREAIVFNLVESFSRRPETVVYVPAICEAAGRESTGGGSACLELTLDKARARTVFEMARIPTPAGVCVPEGAAVPFGELPGGPYIVKPAAADASEGIWAETSVVNDSEAALAAAVETIHARFHQPALVEQLVGSREINVTVLEDHGRLEVMPIAEIDFSAFPAGQPRIVDYAAKWETGSFAYNNTPRVIPANLPPKVASRIRELAARAWRAAGCRDYARVDFRLDVEDRLFVLEVNANPDVSPDAGLAAALAAAGRSYSSFVKLVVTNAVQRLEERKRSALPRRRAGADTPEDSSVEIRPVRESDQPALVEIIRTTTNFRPDEVMIAEEVLDDSIRRGAESGYVSLVAACDGKVAGWVCYGPTPCTLGTYDIYWIAVDAATRRNGLGKSLMAAAEEGIREAGGRLVVLDTSGNDSYIPTRAFYRRLNYEEAARVTGFYAPGDDKVVFAKRLLSNKR